MYEQQLAETYAALKGGSSKNKDQNSFYQQPQGQQPNLTNQKQGSFI